MLYVLHDMRLIFRTGQSVSNKHQLGDLRPMRWKTRLSSLISSTVSARPNTPIPVLVSNDAMASSQRRSKAGRTTIVLALPVMEERRDLGAAVRGDNDFASKINKCAGGVGADHAQPSG